LLTKTRTAAFIRHYIEMVVVMFAGMIVLGLPGEAGLHAIGSGTSQLRADAPALVFLGMAFTMTLPMVVWMRYRGHRWQPSLEMAASMIIPTLIASALLATDVAGFDALMGLEHIAMLLGMLIAMLLRVDEYAGHHHHHRSEPVTA
jgi:flagellar biosynthetic protein FliP